RQCKGIEEIARPGGYVTIGTVIKSSIRKARLFQVDHACLSTLLIVGEDVGPATPYDAAVKDREGICLAAVDPLQVSLEVSNRRCKDVASVLGQDLKERGEILDSRV